MNIKKLISAIVSTAMAFSFLTLIPARVSAATNAGNLTEDGWEFTSSSGTLKFNEKYTGTALTRDSINALDGNSAGGAFQVTDI